MRFPKLCDLNIYVKFSKFLLLIIFIFLTVNCIHKDRQQVLSEQNTFEVSEDAVNINTASAEELQKIPNIGAKTAANIIRHREEFGDFRKPEHLLLIERISDARFREMRKLIKTE